LAGLGASFAAGAAVAVVNAGVAFDVGAAVGPGAAVVAVDVVVGVVVVDAASSVGWGGAGAATLG
jgi:hypothetical protein